MIYPKDFEGRIGFLPIRNAIIEKCETRLGKEAAASMSFSANRHSIIKELNCVSEMKQILSSLYTLPPETVYDILPYIKGCMMEGSFINAEQLHECALTFAAMRGYNDFFSQKDDSGNDFPYLKNDFSSIPSFIELENEINRCIDKNGEIKDSASPELYEIRRSIESASKSVHRIMMKVIEDSAKNGLVEPDVTPALRDGHLVIPVSAAKRKGISGILHDTSATGKTVFIEPAEVVQTGNRLRELKAEEEREIIKILIRITNLVRPNSLEIEQGCRQLAQIDFIKAKANFALETDGQLPTIENEPEIDWFHAIHPALFLTLKKHGKDVVPLNLNLSKKHRILLISGPNAGGKSVTLKTVGVVQYMMQCGILPTLYYNSHMGIFSNIFIDIGDEQSMENDLSTYSSHLSNMKFFLQHSSDKTLLLADEMGSGTEPQIGASLAQAILAEFCKSGCFGIITTHYQNLKVFAENQEGLINGAMLYDRQHFRPTFQLSVGHPGSSFAIEIARNIGLPSSVIELAKELVGSDYVNSEKFLLDIQRDRRYWNNKRQDIKEKEHRINKLLEEYENSVSELKSQRSSILKSAKIEAKEIIEGANAKIERSIHEIRKSQADKERAKQIRKEIEDYKQSLEKETNEDSLPQTSRLLKHRNKKKTADSHNFKNKIENELKSEFAIGDYVRMKNGGVTGRIISIEGKKTEVAFGNLRTKVDSSNLEKTSKPKETIKENVAITSSSSQNSASRERQLNFKTDIDVRGMRADEALQAITYFIDDAIQFNAYRVRILHGTGHGILKTLIREQLQANPMITSFRDEDVRFGGAGITVVDIS
ncbi:MAG: Smr/MutS family protein [Muribaculaceae bacterium]|nr:Smr/MutS family protein [Muribaculaceae bacterium]